MSKTLFKQAVMHREDPTVEHEPLTGSLPLLLNWATECTSSSLQAAGTANYMSGWVHQWYTHTHTHWLPWGGQVTHNSWVGLTQWVVLVSMACPPGNNDSLCVDPLWVMEQTNSLPSLLPPPPLPSPSLNHSLQLGLRIIHIPAFIWKVFSVMERKDIL